MEHIYSLILTYKYILLFPLVMVGGPIVTVIAAFLASLGVLDISAVYAVAVLGTVTGDTVYYLIGRIGGHKFVPKYGRYLGVTEERIKYAEEHYQKHLGKTLLFGKFTEVAIVPILITVGITKVNFRRFLGTVALIEIPKVMMFTLIGFYFGKYYILINQYLHTWASVGFLVIVTGALVYWLFFRKK